MSSPSSMEPCFGSTFFLSTGTFWYVAYSTTANDSLPIQIRAREGLSSAQHVDHDGDLWVIW